MNTVIEETDACDLTYWPVKPPEATWLHVVAAEATPGMRTAGAAMATAMSKAVRIATCLRMLSTPV